jgi:hypothetical protein
MAGDARRRTVRPDLVDVGEDAVVDDLGRA